jgi:Ca2+-binding RTX toxin-like protein
MAYNVTGAAGNDTLNQSVNGGPGTIVGLAGSDCILTGSGLTTVAGDSGEDTIVLQTSNIGTITAEQATIASSPPGQSVR